MSGTPDVPHPDHVVEVRPLPAKPNLEFERKTAKQLLRDVRQGDDGAKDRLHRHLPDAKLADVQLSDAQLVIAREYGFSSWPRLVAYFKTWQQHSLGQPFRPTYSATYYEERAREAVVAHGRRSRMVLPTLSSYVPLYYAKSDEEIFAIPLTEADARLMVARSASFTNWDELMIGAARVEPGMATMEASRAAWFASPHGQAVEACRTGHFDVARELVEEFPELLQPAPSGVAAGQTIMSSALLTERKNPSSEARELTDWLVSKGGDLQSVLNRGLIGGMHVTREEYEWLLARGADPKWIPANGTSLLEHVILRCWNPGPTDALRPLVTPRKALWIAAGLGDVETMREFFTRDGSLTDAARNDRPDFAAVGMHLPKRPNVSDQEMLWEVSLIALFNHRWAAFDLLLSKGLPIDYSPYISSNLHWAVGNRNVTVVEQLLVRGANLDLKGVRPDATAREMAAEGFKDSPDDPAVRRVYQLCCGDLP